MICSSNGEHVCHQFGADWSSTLVFFVLSGVGKTRNNCGYSFCTCNLTSINHDKKLHKIVVDFATSRLNNVNIFTSDRLSNFYASFQIAEFFGHYFSSVDAKAITNFLTQVRMRRSWMKSREIEIEFFFGGGGT